MDLAAKMKIKVASIPGHTLYDLNKLYSANNKAICKTYTSFMKLIAEVGPPSKPSHTPKQMPKLDVDPSNFPVPQFAKNKIELRFPGGER